MDVEDFMPEILSYPKVLLLFCEKSSLAPVLFLFFSNHNTIVFPRSSHANSDIYYF